ncbi:uncharacterized protein LOC131282209 [Anopheles ziemanni]|uniref:uncharacterized protein LOC131282209 n=1 Tax=Anopheles ziemanni TaxID=345580 RepID=UPI0026600208|nr:uncharacterized protein LOC131282209 [Anopheles ziemanni]
MIRRLTSIISTTAITTTYLPTYLPTTTTTTTQTASTSAKEPCYSISPTINNKTAKVMQHLAYAEGRHTEEGEGASGSGGQSSVCPVIPGKGRNSDPFTYTLDKMQTWTHETRVSPFPIPRSTRHTAA